MTVGIVTDSAASIPPALVLQYGITVVNMSLAESKASSYLIDPVDAAAEAAQFSGMSVVAGQLLADYVLRAEALLANGRRHIVAS